MSRMLQRVFLLGLLSHVLAFSTMFVMLSSAFHNGPQSVASFFATGLLLALIAFFRARKGGERGESRWLWLRMVILVAGLGSMVIWGSEQVMMLNGIFLLLQVLFLRRTFQMVEDLSYIRRVLYEQFQRDMGVLIALGIAAACMPIDPGWQMKAVPFFIAFVLVRMYAMSAASQMTKHVENAPQQLSRAVKWQGRVPLLLVGAAVLGGWLLSALGLPVLIVLDWVLTPVMYAFGWVIQLMLTAVDGSLTAMIAWLNKVLLYILCLLGLCDPSGPFEVFEPDPLPEGKSGLGGMTSFLSILMMILIAILLYRMFRKRQTGLFQAAGDGVVEIREFIHDDLPGTGRANFFAGAGARTRMRKIYRNFLLTMKKQGYERGEGETATEYVQKIAADRPADQASMRELTDYYMQERYGGKQVNDKLSRSEQLAQELKKK